MKQIKHNTTAIGAYLLFFLLVLTSNTLSAQCDMTIYVTPSGSALAAGTKAAPTTLEAAVIRASDAGGAHIKMGGGSYFLDNPLYLDANTTIEGGYTISGANGNWLKGSSETVVIREHVNVEGSDITKRLVAFYGTSISDFRLQDLTILVLANAAASGHGVSTYGVVLNACSDYVLSRVEVGMSAGGGEDGVDGQAGAGGVAGTSGEDGDSDDQDSEGAGGAGGSGAGSGGGTGGSGAATTSSCCASGSVGGNGENASSPRSGGGGSGGGRGGQEDNDGGAGGVAGQNSGGVGPGCVGIAGVETGCNSSSGACVTGLSGGDGCPGIAGADGTNGIPGELPSTLGVFPATGGRGTNATDGEGGSGAAGGGGGAGESCFVGSDGAGAGGGGGGGGGEGGTGGTGGWSGGHAIALFLVENGSNGQVLSCDFGGFAGSGGTGGTGGIGGIGGVGGAGGGDTSGDFEIGCGGTGGAGGTGGKGGDGGDGRPGEVHVVSVASGLPLETDESIGSITPGDFDNSNIWVDDIPCTNRTISYTDIRGHAITEWTFGSGAVPATATGRTVSTTYTTPGIKTIIVKQEFVPGMPEIDTFTNFITITEEPIAQASFTTTAPQINGTYTIATGSSINFAAADAGETYAWNMDGGSTPNTFEGDEFKELNNITFNTPGTYTINLLYKNECCGDSEAATLDVVVENALPVTWSHLEAKLSRGGKSVLLDWRTVREENNSGFEIWRAKDSRNWEYLAFVDGRGTSDVSTNYTYEDEQPRVGRNFYRLVQVDFGGAEHISQIVDVLRSSTASLGLYPNPTKGILNITGVPAGRSYQVRNSVGQLLMAGKVTAEALQVEQLVGGVYYLVVGTEIQRFIVKPKG